MGWQKRGTTAGGRVSFSGVVKLGVKIEKKNLGGWLTKTGPLLEPRQHSKRE